MSSAPAASIDRPALTFIERYGPWALISGASEGTGAEFALQAAAQGLNVVLVARRPDKLDQLATQLRAEHGVEVRICALDLSAPGAMRTLQEHTAGLDIGLVVFNAGGDSVGGRFLDSSVDAWRGLLQRNIDFLTEACHVYASALVRRGRGGLLLVGSEAALGGTARLAIYTATKGYALNLGESLWLELKPHGVDVLNLLLGATDTPKLRTVLAKHGLSADTITLTPSAEVARIGLEQLADGPTVVLAALQDSTDTRMSAKSRRERVDVQSRFLDHFYGAD